MRRLLLACFALVGAVFADDATIIGQKIVTEAPIGWGSSMSRTLKVTSNAYLRDSASTFVSVDTSLTSVGGAGACSQTIVLRSGTALNPQLRCEISYGARATDTAQDGFQIYAATRYRVPTGADTAWSVQQYQWDSTRVVLTHTNPGLLTTRTTRFVNMSLSGQDARVCIRRTSTGPGAGDTLVFNNNWLRCW